MNSLDALNAITRRALRINYISPAVCIFESAQSGSGSSGSSTLDILPIFRREGPAILNAAIVSGPSVSLTWTTLTYAFSYFVYRSTNPAGPFTTIVNGTHNNFFIDLTPGAGTYFYKVTALEPSAGETLPSPLAGPITI